MFFFRPEQTVFRFIVLLFWTFRGFRANVSTFHAKRFGIGEGSPSRLPQMPDDGFHLRLQEGVATGIVTHGRQFFLQQRTGVYPPNQGLDGTLGSVAWLVEQSQFGLAIGTDLKHV